ncbi:DUF3015 family protein [Bacteriovoracaceae bacterium]|nr:DUF3015 family protein [Bacteriovoracaceae bacterium]
MKYILVMFTVFISTQCFAFKWEKCKKIYKGSNNLIFSTTAAGMSSSSYLSSTGDCAMIGMASHDKKVFLAHNLENIQVDSARRDGEYISAYASLSGCNETGRNALPGLFQNNFIQIYGEGFEKTPKAIYESMEQVIQTDPVTSENCMLKT